jgi:hypothetical protein
MCGVRQPWKSHYLGLIEATLVAKAALAKVLRDP